MKRKERFSPERVFVESSEEDKRKRFVGGGSTSKLVSHQSSAPTGRQRRHQQQRQNMSAVGGQTGAGSHLLEEDEKDMAPVEELDSRSASLSRSIPLQQLRALARAAEGGCSTGTFHSHPCLMNQSLAGLGGCSSAAGTEESRTQLRKRRADHEQGEATKNNRLASERLGPTSKTAKKSCNKKMPAEVSSRRPHLATGQPLVCTSVLPAHCVRENSLLPRGVGFTSRGSDICPSAASSSGGGSRNSSRKKAAEDSQRSAESCAGQRDARGRVRLGKEDAEEQTRPATSEGFAEPPFTPEATYASGKGVDGLATQHRLPAEEPLQVRGVASHTEQTTEKTFLRRQQEREAALQRHLKSLRSLRLRLAAEGKGAARAHALRIGREVRDPRFSEACGPLDLRMVGKAYAFLDNMRKQEAAQLQRLLKRKGHAAQAAAGDAGELISERRRRSGATTLCRAEAEELAAQKALQRLRSQEEARKRKGVELAVKGRLAREEKDRIAQTGKRPFFVSRKEVNRLVQAEWQKRRPGGNAGGQRRAAKQEEKKARNKLAKERRLSLVPVRRLVEEAAV